nr:putative ribonuclease H-like domain-containing protein [Tanacetum cinerariifolium]
TDRKLASTPIDTEKPLLKDPNVKRIFRYLKGKPHLGLWYTKDSPFNLVAYTDSDYGGESLNRKFTIGGCQFLGCRLISWQCKKQTVVATLSTEADPDQTVSGKDSSNPLMADNLPKIVWYSIHHVALMKSWLVQKQTTIVSSKLMLFGLTIDAARLMLLGYKVKEKQAKDKIGTKPDKKGKRGKAWQCRSPVIVKKAEKEKKIQTKGTKNGNPNSCIMIKKYHKD